MTSAPVRALREAHPGRFSLPAAELWWREHRTVLRERLQAVPAAGAAVSSGCAASGARRHAEALAQAAGVALDRWERGQGVWCDVCHAVLPLERLAAAPAAVRCTGCCPPSSPDTRWCR